MLQIAAIEKNHSTSKTEQNKPTSYSSKKTRKNKDQQQQLIKAHLLAAAPNTDDNECGMPFKMKSFSKQASSGNRLCCNGMP